MLRGLRTLELRANRSADTAAYIVPKLEAHPKIAKMHWPFSEQNPQLNLARKQMQRCSGMFSIEIQCNDATGVERFCDALQHFLLACLS